MSKKPANKKLKTSNKTDEPQNEPRLEDLFYSLKVTLIMVGQAIIKFEDYMPHQLKYIGIFLKYFMISFNILLPFHLAILNIKSVYDAIAADNLQKMSSSGFLVVIYTCGTIYVSFFIYKYPQIQRFFKFYNLNYKHESFEGLTYVNVYRGQRILWKIMFYWQLACVGAVFLWCTIPIVTFKHVLPLQCWYPFDPLQPGTYKIIYFIQVLAQYQIGLGYSNCCAIYMFTILNTCGQLDVLFCNLKNYIYNAEILSGRPLEELIAIQNGMDLNNEEINQYWMCTERKTNLKNYLTKIKLRQNHQKNSKKSNFTKTLNESFVECIQHHRFILKLAAEIEDIFTVFNLIKSFQSTFLLCFLAFTFVYVNTDFFESANLLQYLFLSVIEVLMFTYPAEVLQQQSLKVNDAIYRSPWYLHIKDIKSNWLCLMPNNYSPIKMTGLKLFDMDVSRFRNIMTLSFSFLTLLQTMYDKKAALEN